jgi:hypothetical protein
MSENKNFNLFVDKAVADLFEQWDEKTPGQKGEKLTGALRAIMALYAIDEGIVHHLMKPNLSLDDAIKAIRSMVAEIEYRQLLEQLTPKQKAQLLQDAKLSKQKAFHK